MGAQQQRAVVIPIVGVRTEAHIADNLRAATLELTPGELERFDEVSRIPLGFPNDFGGARLAHGDTFDLVQDHRRTIDALV